MRHGPGDMVSDRLCSTRLDLCTTWGRSCVVVLEFVPASLRERQWLNSADIRRDFRQSAEFKLVVSRCQVEL
jgi:hypothetical protein